MGHNCDGNPGFEHTILPRQVEFTLPEVSTRFSNNTLESVISELEGPEFQALFELHSQLGMDVYLTGGIVRDALIGAEPKDFDFVVSKHSHDGQSSEDMIRSFEDFFGSKTYLHQGDHESQNSDDASKWVISGTYGKLVLAGKGFGVYKFTPIGTDLIIDIAFPRTDHAPVDAVGGAKYIVAQSNPFLSFAVDVERRDFTINAIGLQIFKDDENKINSSIVDYVGGLDDIEKKVLRAVGNPDARLSESLDRVLRAVRFAQKGFEVETDLLCALKRAVAGDGVHPETRAFQKRYADGSFVVPRELVGINFLKALKLNPIGTIRLMDEIGALHDLLPDIVEYRPAPSIPGSIGQARRESISIADSSLLETEDNSLMRREFFELSLRSIETHLRTSPHASVDELLFLLTLNTGKSYQTLYQVMPDGREIHHHDAYVLSIEYFNRMIKLCGLDTLPADSPNRLHPKIVRSWIGKYSEAVSLLQPENSNGNQTTKRINKIVSIFPDFNQDIFWTIIRSEISANPAALRAKEALIQFENHLVDMRQKIDATKSSTDQRLFSGVDAMQSFWVKNSTIGVLLNCANTFVKTRQARGETAATSQLEKISLLPMLFDQVDLIKAWDKSITKEDSAVLGATAEKRGGESIKRAVYRALKRRAAQSWLGLTLEEISAIEVENGMADEHSITKQLQHQSDLHETMDGEFGTVLYKAFIKDTHRWITWMDASLRSKDSLVSRLMPEVFAMAQTHHESDWHMEGTVWAHTKLTLEAMCVSHTPITIEEFYAALYHDCGKPATKTFDSLKRRTHFYGHEEVSVELFSSAASILGISHVVDTADIVRSIAHHQDQFRHELRTALDVRRLFPHGTNDLLYTLMDADIKGRIVAPSLAQRRFGMYELIDKWAPLIEAEQQSYPGYFDMLLQTHEIQDVLGTQQVKEKVGVLYEEFLYTIHRNESIDAIQLPLSALQNNFSWAIDYAKRKLFTGLDAQVCHIENRPLIGQIQKALAMKLVETKRIPTPSDVSDIVFHMLQSSQ